MRQAVTGIQFKQWLNVLKVYFLWYNSMHSNFRRLILTLERFTGS